MLVPDKEKGRYQSRNDLPFINRCAAENETPVLIYNSAIIASVTSLMDFEPSTDITFGPPAFLK